jgi:hypothetical protein
MSSPLRPLIDEMLRAIRDREFDEFTRAFRSMVEGIPGLTPAELTAGIGELVPLITADGAVGPFSVAAMAAAGLVEQGGSPMPMRDALPERALVSLTSAVAFPGRWKAASGGRPLPAPGDQEMLVEAINGTLADVLERIGAEFGKRAADKGYDTPGADEAGLALALQWYDVIFWVGSLRMAMLDREFRASFPTAERDRIWRTARALKDALAGDGFLEAAFLEQVALVLDDEQLIVIDPASQRGLRVTISGISDNEQLYTLLASVLAEHGFTGIEPPLPSWLDWSSGDKSEEVYRRMRLFDGQGKHVHPKDWPADIGALDGTRVVVVHPPDECNWRKGRPFPVMVPSMVPDSELSRAEVTAWLERIEPATEDSYSLYRRKNSFWRGNRHGNIQLSRTFRLSRCPSGAVTTLYSATMKGPARYWVSCGGSSCCDDWTTSGRASASDLCRLLTGWRPGTSQPRGTCVPPLLPQPCPLLAG